MRWRPQEWRGGAREERSWGGSLSGYVYMEVGCMWWETQGLLAWVLVEALFSTWMIITQCQLHILLGNCTSVFGIFLWLQIWHDSNTCGRREKRKRAEVIKGIPLFQKNTPMPVPTLYPAHMMLGEGEGQGDLRKAEPILSSQSGAT